MVSNLLLFAEAEAVAARRLLQEEAAAAPAPAAEDALLEGDAILRAVQEAGFELTPEELALLELETAAAPAPAPGEPSCLGAAASSSRALGLEPLGMHGSNASGWAWAALLLLLLTCVPRLPSPCRGVNGR